MGLLNTLQIAHEAVVNSGSFRIVGIDAEEFIRVWDYRKERVTKSKMQMFKEELAAVVPDRPSLDNIDVFSVMLHSEEPMTTDVRFSVHGSPFYKPVKLNGILLRHRFEVRTFRCPLCSFYHAESWSHRRAKF